MLSSRSSIPLIALILSLSCSKHAPIAEFPLDQQIQFDRSCRVTEEWIQQGGLQSLDILFMVDDSESMHNDRRTIAHFLYQFFQLLDSAGVSFCTGLMLGHAEEGKAGVFISTDGREHQKVMCNYEWTIDEIASQMQLNMLSISLQGSAGEAGLYSLKEAVTTNLSANQRLDFFRDNAALAVIFISDENDISESRDPGTCPEGPYTFNPIGLSVVGNNCEEAAIRKKYYSLQDGFLRWGYHQVYSEVVKLKDGDPLFSASIAYQPGVEAKGFTEDYGYGYNEFVDLTENGSRIDLKLVSLNHPAGFLQAFLEFTTGVAKGNYRQSKFELAYTAANSTVHVWVEDELLPRDVVFQEGDMIRLHPSVSGNEGEIIKITYTPSGGCDPIQGRETKRPQSIDPAMLKKGG